MPANALRTADTRINPVRQENRIKTVEKLASGGLRVVQNSGATFDVAPEDETIQTFLVYLILDGEA